MLLLPTTSLCGPMQELDALSISLASRIAQASVELNETPTGATRDMQDEPRLLQPAHATAAAAAAAGAARAAATRHVRTLSDDEDFMVLDGGGAASDSDVGTEELMMGRVDWSLPAGSDDEAPPGCVT
jgi:hypothetical protein